MACEGNEQDTFHCPRGDARPGRPTDPFCAMGCLGPDGIYGTDDDTIDPTCTHAIDQGAICARSDSLQNLNPNLQTCRQVGGAGVGDSGNSQQPAVFGCVQFYSTNCQYDVTHAGVTAGHGSVGSYVDAMRAFAECSAVVPEPEGYCHGALNTASKLSNHEVCVGSNENNDDWRNDPNDGGASDHDDAGGSTTDIGFREWLRFRVLQRHSPSDPRLVARHSNSVPRER